MDNEMRRMQQEAIHRVNEMQARAKQKLQGSGNAPSRMPTEGNVAPPPPPPPDIPERAPEKAVPAAAPDTNLQGLFDALMEDRERTMILVLILLLFTEQADTAVIFALLYTIL